MPSRGRVAHRRIVHVLIGALGLCLMLAASASAQLRGVALHPMDTDSNPAVLGQEFSMLQQAGANSVRFDIYWQSVEWTARGDYDPGVLARMDSVFAGAQAHGLKVILDIWATPCWASSAPLSITQGCASGWWTRPVNHYPPVQTSDYANFAKFVVKRWGSALAALELWNEPNGNFFTAPDKAASYARLVRAAYTAAKSVDPRLPVIMSLAGTDSAFLAQLYADGVRGFYDGIAVHPYNDPQLNGLKQFHAFQARNGDSSQLWVTEVGWPSNAVGEAAQAANISSVLTQLAALKYVAAAEIYEMRDKGTSADDENHFGLTDMSLNPKPAWDAFVAILKSLAKSGGTTSQPTTSTLTGSPAVPLTVDAQSTTTGGRKNRQRHHKRHRRRR